MCMCVPVYLRVCACVSVSVYGLNSNHVCRCGTTHVLVAESNARIQSWWTAAAAPSGTTRQLSSGYVYVCVCARGCVCFSVGHVLVCVYFCMFGFVSLFFSVDDSWLFVYLYLYVKFHIYHTQTHHTHTGH